MYNNTLQDLSTLRHKWIGVEAVETRLLREMTIADGLALFALLYEAYAPRFRADEALDFAEHEAVVLSFRKRLARLDQGLKARRDMSVEVRA